MVLLARAVFFCFSFVILVYVVLCLIVLGCQYRCLERLVSDMTYYVSSGTLNPTHSLTQSVSGVGGRAAHTHRDSSVYCSCRLFSVSSVSDVVAPSPSLVKSSVFISAFIMLSMKLLLYHVTCPCHAPYQLGSVTFSHSRCSRSFSEFFMFYQICEADIHPACY